MFSFQIEKANTLKLFFLWKKSKQFKELKKNQVLVLSIYILRNQKKCKRCLFLKYISKKKSEFLYFRCLLSLYAFWKNSKLMCLLLTNQKTLYLLTFLYFHEKVKGLHFVCDFNMAIFLICLMTLTSLKVTSNTKW